MSHFIQIAAAALLVATPALAQDDDLNRYGEKGYVPAHELVEEPRRHGIPEDHYEGVKSNYPVTSHVQFSDYQCPPNFSGMFRGTLYCYNGVLKR